MNGPYKAFEEATILILKEKIETVQYFFMVFKLKSFKLLLEWIMITTVGIKDSN